MRSSLKVKIIGVILIVLMVFPLSAFTVMAADSSVSSASMDDDFREALYKIDHNGRTPQEDALYQQYKFDMLNEQMGSYIEHELSKKIDLSRISSGIDGIRKDLPGFIKSIKDANDGGDFNSAAFSTNVISMVSNICTMFGPYGQLAGAALELCTSIVNLIMGGEDATSEIAQMEDRLNQKLDEIQGQLTDIEEEINSLSNEINKSTNLIIKEVTLAIDNSYSKQELNNFMLSGGKGDFGYNQYRNYIYGEIENNGRSNTAYYAHLKQAIKDDASDETVKYYYDQLYTVIMDEREAYYDCVTGSTTGKSIVQHYYDVVSSNQDLVQPGMSAEVMAIMFAFDIYQTELMTAQIISSCNLYQYTNMLIDEVDCYVYDKSGDKKVMISDVESANGIQSSINARVAEIHDQLAADVAYVLNYDDSYVVKSSDGELFEVVKSDPETYGNLLGGQTVYLNRIPESVCNLFSFDADDFRYDTSIASYTDGVICVDANVSDFEVSLYYKNRKLDSIHFTVSQNVKFYGGDGSAAYPYLISTPAQLMSIANGLDKHYRLISDIDFNNAQISPIGMRLNSGDEISYDTFTGSLDGNGYTVKNANIVGGDYAGLFCIIGEKGAVSDLNLYNVKVSSKIYDAKRQTTKLYAGMIAGKNNGIIKYCSVDSDGTTQIGWYQSNPVYMNNTLEHFIQDESVSKNVIRAILKNVISDYSFLSLNFNKTIKEIVFDDSALKAPYYGVELTVDNSTSNRNIYSYAGGIAGYNSRMIFGCVIENTVVYASSTHDFGGDPSATNQQFAYSGGICGENTGSISASVVQKSAGVFSFAKAVFNPKGRYYPYANAYSGGITAKTNSLDEIKYVISELEKTYSEYELDCQSNYSTDGRNSSEPSHSHIPGYIEGELNRIKTDEDILGYISEQRSSHVTSFTYEETDYSAGAVLKYGLEYTKTDTMTGGVKLDYYKCDALAFTLALAEDGRGMIFDVYDSVKAEFTYATDDEGSIITNGDSLATFGISALYIENGTVYAESPNSFNTDNFKYFVDGEEVNYRIVNVYGFNTDNSSFDSASLNVAVVIGVDIDAKTLYFAEKIPLTVEPNRITEVEILDLSDDYTADEFNLNGLTIKYSFAVGNPEYLTVNGQEKYNYCSHCKRYPAPSDIIDDKCKTCDNEITLVDAPVFEGEISELILNGTWVIEREITVTFNGREIKFSIDVVCEHGNNFTNPESGYEKSDDMSVNPTCFSIGYEAYVCKTCGDVQYFYLRKTEHKPSSEPDGKSDPTCAEKGSTGDVYCLICEILLSERQEIPRIPHSYKYIDSANHGCYDANGGLIHSENHHYSVQESLELRDNGMGAKAWYIVYTYTCVCEKEGKIFTKTEVDTNTVTDEAKNLPTVVVSNGYVTKNGSDEVVVYVRIVNNRDGFKSALFGIRYDEGLELINVEDGNVISGSLVKDGTPTNYGYNFIFAGTTLIQGDGNLLKLTFKVSKDARLTDTFDISVVYSDIGTTKDGNEISGGFSDGNGTSKLVTRKGTVKVVDTLPGDIEGDYDVDLMDAVLLAKSFTDSANYPIGQEFADLNLDRAVNPDDIVVLLEYIVGGYGTNLLPQNFDIILNADGYDNYIELPESINVSIYGENNTYNEAGLPELTRKGYKFLGWFDRLYGGNRIDAAGLVNYNQNQEKQALYAQWELNSFYLDIGDATGGESMKVYYTDGEGDILIPADPTKSFNVSFNSDLKAQANSTGTLTFEFDGWYVGDEKKYNTASDIVSDLNNGHLGEVTLVAKFKKEPNIVYPNWKVDGYEDEVLWYAERDVEPSKIVSNADILNCKFVNNCYLVYAKHTPIEYYVIFEFNGCMVEALPGSDDNTVLREQCSIVTTYELSQVKLSKTGSSLKCWMVSVDGGSEMKYDVNGTLGYIPGAVQNSRVTVKAIWEERAYTITFHSNFGDGYTELEKVVTYTISNLDSIELPEFDYPKYADINSFVDWYQDSDCTRRFDKSTLENSPSNIDLFAKWDVWKTYAGVVNEKITAKKVIIDWRTVQDYKNQKIVLQDVAEVYFIGHANNIMFTNLQIEISRTLEDPNVVIYFSDFRMSGYIYQAADSAQLDVTFKCIGENNAINTINDSNKSAAITGFKSLTFEGNGKIKMCSEFSEDMSKTLINVNTVDKVDSCTVTYEFSSTHTQTIGGTNGYVFKGWYLGGSKVSSDRTYTSTDITAINVAHGAYWYAPLSISKSSGDDLSDIGSSEKIYLSITGGSGNYEKVSTSCDSGASASYDASNKSFIITKEADSESGNATVTIKDKTTGQQTSYTVSWSTSSCFTGDTLVQLADGSYARLDSLKAGDVIMSWNSITGEFEAMPISLFWNHGDSWYHVIRLTFDNGKTLSVVTEHGLFDSTLNKYVFINRHNYSDYIGHRFAFATAAGFEDVELIYAEYSYEYTSCYSLRTACNDNAIVEGFLTLTIEDIPGFLTYFEFGEGYMYDKEKMEADIAEYGLYTYDDWKHLGTYEEFVALNAKYLKIVIGKGYMTYEDILRLLEGMRQI